ncbi:hypothetical protein [Candidatus Stoquefichus massiliensis]|uniref:hypothetical protein n=1 Tax=Candidatus Stoquefichus massiliensis TaxID=1470350 RepID=UPI0004813452|nr:hypothetical protein [Candidatus Stoquefichus massiliensis]
MILSKGITGFYEDDNDMQAIEPKLFKKICYEFIQEYPATILSIDTSLINKNFYVSELLLDDKSVYLLMNAYYTYFAFASSINDNITFINISNMNKSVLMKYGWLNKNQLNESYHDILNLLSPIELEQINYWKPQTIGEIIYNYWD